jgi:hypothetical protein
MQVSPCMEIVMTRARPDGTGSRPSVRAVAIPPISGWKLIEAATALCPSAVEIYRNGGEALQTAIERSPSRLSPSAIRDPGLRPGAWLTLQLLAALDDRADLQLSGQKTVWAPSEKIPRLILESTLKASTETVQDGYWCMILDFQRDVATTRCYLRDGSWAPVLPHGLEYVRVNLASKPAFTEEAFAALYRDWLGKRGEMPIPNENECIEKAVANFSGKIRSSRVAATASNARAVLESFFGLAVTKGSPGRGPDHREPTTSLSHAGCNPVGATDLSGISPRVRLRERRHR